MTILIDALAILGGGFALASITFGVALGLSWRHRGYSARLDASHAAAAAAALDANTRARRESTKRIEETTNA